MLKIPNCLFLLYVLMPFSNVTRPASGKTIEFVSSMGITLIIPNSDNKTTTSEQIMETINTIFSKVEFLFHFSLNLDMLIPPH